MTAHKIKLLPVFALLLNATVWGLSWWPLRSLSARELHPLWVSAAIYLFASLLLILWQPKSLRSVFTNPLLILIGLSSGITNGAFNWGVTLGDVVRVVLLFYLMPVWAVLLARLLLGEIITGMSTLRIALALSGAVLVLGNDHDSIPMPQGTGDWLGVLAGMAFALNNVLLRKAEGSAAHHLSLAMILGGFIVPLLMLPTVTHQSLLPVISASSIAIMCAFGAAIIVGNFGLQYGASRLPVNVTAVVMLAEIVIAALSAVWIGGETLTARIIIGGLCILSASLLTVVRVKWSN